LAELLVAKMAERMVENLELYLAEQKAVKLGNQLVEMWEKCLAEMMVM
jgi:hypothetical protein